MRAIARVKIMHTTHQNRVILCVLCRHKSKFVRILLASFPSHSHVYIFKLKFSSNNPCGNIFSENGKYLVLRGIFIIQKNAILVHEKLGGHDAMN
jgi:hypothetical protein